MASLFRKRKKFVVNQPDPTFNVVYLGNVVTNMAKGEQCYEKPLAMIWKAYCSRKRSDISMKLVVSRSGLKAFTKQQGLTEYFAHGTTFCTAPPNYPKVFVWVYKHEGKRMKPEMRCHAALCRQAETPQVITSCLQDKIRSALMEYRREKISRQNVRMNGGTLPRRKLMLITGSQNFRPPISRSKSAPKLHAIEECTVEEEEDMDSQEEEEIPLDDSEIMSIPSSSDWSVSNSPSAGHRSVFPYDRRPSLAADAEFSSHSAPTEYLDRFMTPENLSDELSDMTGRIARLEILHGLGGCSPDSQILPNQLCRPKTQPEPDQISDESGFEEKASLESGDSMEPPEQTIIPADSHRSIFHEFSSQATTITIL